MNALSAFQAHTVLAVPILALPAPQAWLRRMLPPLPAQLAVRDLSQMQMQLPASFVHHPHLHLSAQLCVLPVTRLDNTLQKGLHFVVPPELGRDPTSIEMVQSIVPLTHFQLDPATRALIARAVIVRLEAQAAQKQLLDITMMG